MESVVYLYSKYSSRCKEFSELIEQSTLKGSFNSLCIDNKNIRKVVVASKYSIKALPCVLCFFPNSVVEKYEGEHSFRWINQFVAPPPPPPPAVSQHVKKQEEQKQEYESEEEQDEEEVQVVKKKPRKPVIKNERNSKQTSIEDILSSMPEDDEEEEEDVQVMTGSDISSMVKKSTKQKNKATDIMNIAQQLQKMREEEETEKTKKK